MSETTVVEGGKLKSSDGRVEIAAPVGWVPLKNLNAEAIPQAGNLRMHQIAVIMFEADPEPDPELLSRSAELYVRAISPSADVSNLQEVTVGGLPALFLEFNVKEEGVVVSIQHYTICGRDGFYQIYLSVLPSRANAAKASFRTVVQSFREL